MAINFKIICLVSSLRIVSVFAQNNNSNNLEVFNSYGKWGYSLMPILYNKASITRDFGKVILANKSIPNFQLGVKRHFWRDKTWSFSIGVNLSLLPVQNSSFSLKKEDVFDSFNGFDEKIKSYDGLTLSLPFSLEFKTRIKQNLYYNINTGLNAYFIFSRNNEFVIALTSEELDETREVFASRQRTQDNQLQVSVVFSTGVYFVLKKCIIQTNIVYNKTFQNLWEGEYQFGNLLMSEPTRGDYTVSGDFIGLSTTVYFKKRSKRKKKK